MTNSLVLKLALRFVRSRRKGALTRFISFAATCGIAIGVFAAIVGLSAMNGFEYELENRVLSIIPSAQLNSSRSSFNDSLDIERTLRQSPHILATAPAIEQRAILSANRAFAPLMIAGIDPDKERKVIAEEINMVEDEPEEICYDLLAAKRYAGTNLSKTILGPVENVLRFRGDDVRSYVNRMYTPDNTVIAVVGNIRFEDAIRLVEKYVLPLCGNGKNSKVYPENVVGGGFAKCEKDFEQVNIGIGFPSISFDSELFAVQNIVSFCLGTGMSSRLFQSLRERQGLVYNVYTSCSSYMNNGNFGIYLNTSGGNVDNAIISVADEVKKLVSDGLTGNEIERAKIQLKSSALFSIESILSVMSTCGKYALYTGKAYDVDKNIEDAEKVTIKDVSDFCRSGVFDKPVSMAYVGKKQFIDKKDLYTDFNARLSGN